MGKDNKFSPQEVNIYAAAMVFYTLAKDIGSQQLGIRYNRIKSCSVFLPPSLPDTVTLPNQPPCCLQFE